MNYEKTSNGLVISTIKNNSRIHKLFVGYTKKEATKLFKEYLKTI